MEGRNCFSTNEGICWRFKTNRLQKHSGLNEMFDATLRKMTVYSGLDNILRASSSGIIAREWRCGAYWVISPRERGAVCGWKTDRWWLLLALNSRSVLYNRQKREKHPVPRLPRFVGQPGGDCYRRPAEHHKEPARWITILLCNVSEPRTAFHPPVGATFMLCGFQQLLKNQQLRNIILFRSLLK